MPAKMNTKKSPSLRNQRANTLITIVSVLVFVFGVAAVTQAARTRSQTKENIQMTAGTSNQSQALTSVLNDARAYINGLSARPTPCVNAFNCSTVYSSKALLGGADSQPPSWGGTAGNAHVASSNVTGFSKQPQFVIEETSCDELNSVVNYKITAFSYNKAGAKPIISTTTMKRTDYPRSQNVVFYRDWECSLNGSYQWTIAGNTVAGRKTVTLNSSAPRSTFSTGTGRVEWIGMALGVYTGTNYHPGSNNGVRMPIALQQYTTGGGYVQRIMNRVAVYDPLLTYGPCSDPAFNYVWYTAPSFSQFVVKSGDSLTFTYGNFVGLGNCSPNSGSYNCMIGVTSNNDPNSIIFGVQGSQLCK